MNGLFDAFEVDPTTVPAAFMPVARYFSPMDCLIYVRRECSYRALRLTEYVTILLDPQKDEAVGVKIKGTRHVIERHLAILRGAGMRVGPNDALRMLGLAETALTIDGEITIAAADELRRRYVPAVLSLATQAGEITVQEVEPIAA